MALESADKVGDGIFDAGLALCLRGKVGRFIEKAHQSSGRAFQAGALSFHKMS
jgi:hypothetical protein